MELSWTHTFHAGGGGGGGGGAGLLYAWQDPLLNASITPATLNGQILE